MQPPKSTWLATIAGLLLVGSLPATALEVYRWTDAQGIVHFSESPPADPLLPVQALQLEDTGNSSPSRLDLMLEVADRLEASRLAREQARAESRRAAQEAARQQQLAQARPAPVILYPTQHQHPFRPRPPFRPPTDEPRFDNPPPRPPAIPISNPAVAWGGDSRGHR